MKKRCSMKCLRGIRIRLHGVKKSFYLRLFSLRRDGCLVVMLAGSFVALIVFLLLGRSVTDVHTFYKGKRTYVFNLILTMLI